MQIVRADIREVVVDDFSPPIEQRQRREQRCETGLRSVDNLETRRGPVDASGLVTAVIHERSMDLRGAAGVLEISPRNESLARLVVPDAGGPALPAAITLAVDDPHRHVPLAKLQRTRRDVEGCEIRVDIGGAR